MTLGHLLGRMTSIAVTYNRAVLMGRECQRLWRELMGLMNFIHLVQPILTGAADPPEELIPHWFIGAVTEDARHVQLLHRAGVPVWHIRPFDVAIRAGLRTEQKKGVPYALATATMRSPAETACIERHPDNLPWIYDGPPQDARRLKHLHRYATLRVAQSRSIDADDKDPLDFSHMRRPRDFTSVEAELRQMPSFIRDVASGPPDHDAGEAMLNLPPVDLESSGVHEEEDMPQYDILPAHLLAGDERYAFRRPADEDLQHVEDRSGASPHPQQPKQSRGSWGQGKRKDGVTLP
ncbi:hypothetical protein HDZ31DRAFT_70601 [Schizophyllum fasciatum]